MLRWANNMLRGNSSRQQQAPAHVDQNSLPGSQQPVFLPQQMNCSPSLQQLLQQVPIRHRPTAEAIQSIAHALATKAADLPIPKRHALLEAAAGDELLKPAFAEGSNAASTEQTTASLQQLFSQVLQAPAAADEAVQAQPEIRPSGEAALRLSVLPEYGRYGLAQEAARAVISLKAAKESASRAEVSLTCVLDRSGSMSGNLIDLVKETVHFLIDQLTDRDYLGLVSYASDVTEDLPLVRMTPHAKQLAHNIVDAMRANGGTALYDGLVHGMRQQLAAETALAGGKVVHACFLCTDGQANQGPRDADTILPGLRKEQDPVGQHVTVHTFGFGQGHSAALLQSIADCQSGVYYYVGKSEDIPAAYGDALGGLLSVVAKGVQVSISPLGGVQVLGLRTGGRMAGTTASFNDIFAEESRELLLQLQLPASQQAGAVDTARVDLEYTDMATGQRVQASQVLVLHRQAEPRPADVQPEELVYVTAARYETVDAIEEAQKLSNDMPRAHNVLDAHISRLSAGPVQSPSVNMLVQQATTARAQIKPRFEFNQEAIAMVSTTAHALKQQRCATSSVIPAQGGMFDNKSKAAYRGSAAAYVGSSQFSKLKKKY